MEFNKAVSERFRKVTLNYQTACESVGLGMQELQRAAEDFRVAMKNLPVVGGNIRSWDQFEVQPVVGRIRQLSEAHRHQSERLVNQADSLRDLSHVLTDLKNITKAADEIPT